MANEKYYVIPATRTVTAGMKEKDSTFLCPANSVLTGRYHTGDENGTTQYEYASLKAIDSSGNPVAGTITVEDVKWDTSLKESSGSGYDAPSNRVIVGRKHSGDENGQTQYATALVKLNGKPTILEDGKSSASIKESSGIWFKTDSRRVMTGRHHSGDENGQTYYNSATIVLVLSASTDPAPAGTIIVPNVRTQSAGIKESDSSFLCPAGTVLTGRYHWGDENGTTQYEYSSLKAIDPQGRTVVGLITIEDIRWEDVIHESVGFGYDAPLNRIVVGRRHTRDEGGLTLYATGIIKFNGHPTEIRNYTTSESHKESEWGWFKTSENQVITGRHHFDDENGNTYYCMGTVHCDISVKPLDRFRVIVALHPDEYCFPMNPIDFIRLSRFRRHNSGATDDGYNKNTGQFVNGNSHSSEYYNIPVSIIDSYYVKPMPGHPIYNLRPYDENSIGSGEVFLQPDNHLYGDINPNGRIPVFTYSSYYKTASGATGERREFWLFYGYDAADRALNYSHQGDWERVILDIVNNSIQGAWLSAHKDLTYYSANQLQISESDGIQTLRVFSGVGTHAHYSKPGISSFTDATADGGYQWRITDNVESLEFQLWRNYAGAWGEVGLKASTTGPLGPWYKRYDLNE